MWEYGPHGIFFPGGFFAPFPPARERIKKIKEEGIEMTTQARLRIFAEAYKEQPTGKEVEGTVELLEEAAECIDRLSDSEGRDAVYRRCICEYGTQPQIDMALEEMSELTKALLKWRRAEGAELTAARDNIVDELADVRIMCRQMEILFQAEDEVEKRIDFKVNRQRKRLDERKEQRNE